MTTPTQRFPVTVYFENHPRLNRSGHADIIILGESPKKVAEIAHDLFKSSGYEVIKIKTKGLLKYQEWTRSDLENRLNQPQ